MSSTKDTKPTKPRSPFSGMTPTQIRKHHQSQVNPEIFKKYEAFCKDGLKLIRTAPADYTTAYDISLLQYLRIYAGSPALTGNLFFDKDIQSIFDSERARFIEQITEGFFMSNFSKMVSELDLPTTTSWRKTELMTNLPMTCKVLLELYSGSDGETIFIVDPLNLVSLLPDEFKPLFEKKQPSAGAVSAPVQKSPFIGFKPVVGNFAGQSLEDRVCSELTTLSHKEITLVRCVVEHKLKSSKALVKDSSRADADAKAGDGDESDDESDDEPDDEPEQKCSAYSIEHDVVKVKEMIHGRIPYDKDFHRKFQHCRDQYQCRDCGTLCACLTVCLKIQLREHCEDGKSIDRLVEYYKSSMMNMALPYYLRTIIGAESVLAQKLESGERCDLIQISKSLELLGFPSETEEEMKEREMKQRQRQALDMEAFLKHSDIETHGMGAYHSVRDCGCDSRFRCPHMMYE
jgi:hypothetical protein